MNILDVTIDQLKRAAAIKQQIEGLNKELGRILGVAAKSGATATKKRAMSPAWKKSLAAARKARWAKVQGVKPANPGKKTMSRATRAKLSAKLKAFWAAKRAGKK